MSLHHEKSWFLSVSCAFVCCTAFAQDWTFTPNTDPDEYYEHDTNVKVQGFISDGNYRLGVQTNKSNRGLVLYATRLNAGAGKYYPCHAWLAGSGDLDLRKPITDAQSRSYYISGIGQQAMDTAIQGLRSGEKISATSVTALYLPSTCSAISIYCFRGHTALTNIEFNCSVSLSECCFTSCSGLKQVFFRSGVPTSFGPTDPSKYAFANGPSAKKIRFYISMRDAYLTGGWDAVRASATPVTQEAFNQDYPGDDSPVIGVVPTTSFRTKAEQYLCFIPETTSTALRLSPGADASFVTFSPAAQGGVWRYGTEITATVSIPAAAAEGANGWRFCGWEGEDVPAGTGAAASFTFTLLPNTDVLAHFHRALLFTSSSATAGTITDGNWTLNCTRQSDKTELTLPGDCVVSGSGDMDLSGPITDSSDTAYTIVQFNGGPFNSTKTTNPIYSFYSPTTTVSISYNLFNGHTFVTNAVIRSDFLTYINQNTFMNCTALQEARFEAPSLVSTTSADAALNANQFTGCSSLQRLVLKFPALVEMKHNFVSGAPLGLTDLSTWQLPFVTNLADSAISVSADPGPHGTLSLPALVNMDKDGVKGFVGNVTDLQLGAGSLMRLGTQAFATLKGARRIELGVADGFTCSANSFGNDALASLTNLVFTGTVTPTEEAVTNLLSKVPLLSASNSQHPAVFIPVMDIDWQNWLARPTAEEKANLYPSWVGKKYRLLGIASESRRNAWVFTNSPRGFVLMFK